MAMLALDLAKMLHDSGREAVEKRWVVRDDLPIHPFVEWDDLTENAKKGRISQANYLLSKLLITPKDEVPELRR